MDIPKQKKQRKPKELINYQNGKIYMVEPTCEYEEGEVYYGSTASTLVKRLYDHKKKSNKCKSRTLVDKYGRDNIKIVLIKLFPCNSVDELNAEEGIYHRTYKCVNKNVAGQTPKQYREANKEKIKQYQQANAEQMAEYRKQYRQANAEQIAEKGKKYYEANAEQIAEKGKKYYEANKEQMAEKQKKYYEANKEKRKQYRQANAETIAEKKKQRYLKKKAELAMSK